MRRYIYGEADEKFIKDERNTRKPPRENPMDHYIFSLPAFLKTAKPLAKKTVPIAFKCTPKTLVELSAAAVDKMKLPSVYEWTNKDVCNWIAKYGYPHYQNTFRVNLISGRKLLLVDAQVLCSMNITNFDDIKHITYGIRQLFYFEMTNFMRSISLAPQYHEEMYKLFMVKTGRKYDRTRRSDLWRRLQMICRKEPYFLHWEIMEKWLACDLSDKSTTLIGGARHRQVQKCKPEPPSILETKKISHKVCGCIPPCSCHWTEEQMGPPIVLKCLEGRLPDPEFKINCKFCEMPPCTCQWSPSKYEFGQVLSVLQETFPGKYGPLFHQTKQRECAIIGTTDLF